MIQEVIKIFLLGRLSDSREICMIYMSRLIFLSNFYEAISFKKSLDVFTPNIVSKK